MGVMIDQQLNSKPHLESVATKAFGVITLFAKMLPNKGGPRQNCRLLIFRVVSSILPHAFPYCALPTTRAYRIKSDVVPYVVAAMVPIDILTNLSQHLYDPTYPIVDSSHTPKQFTCLRIL